MMTKNLTLEEQLKVAEGEEKKVKENSPTAKAAKKINQIKIALKNAKIKKLQKEIKDSVNECLVLGEKLEDVRREAQEWKKKGSGFDRRYAELHTRLSVKTDRQIKLRNKLKELEQQQEVI